MVFFFFGNKIPTPWNSELDSLSESSSAQPSGVSAQDWWLSGSLLGQWASWYYTPLPGQFFTHMSDDANYPWTFNELTVTIPKPGFGVFKGLSMWVNYDYTWTESPPAAGRQVNCFLGIPYAAPPTGQLRFQPPRPVFLDTRAPWAAKKYRSACPQPLVYMQKFMPNFTDISEDCLYLNLFYPNNSWDPPTKRYPVIVHIHGGGFMYGSSHLYPGHALASTGVLVVTINYRLGPFGFLTTQDFASLGNWGLWDQVEALKWVRDNIQWFRGDKTSVTIMGDDAGGASVGLHMVSPVSRSRGLYHKAIMMSGSDTSIWAVADAARLYPKDYAIQVANSLGCPTNDGYIMIHCLRYYKSAIEITKAGERVISKTPNQPVWGPVLDGAMGFLPRMPLLERKAGIFSSVPLLAGVVRDEGAFEAKRYAPNIEKDPFTEDEWKSGVWKFIEDQLVIWIRKQDVFDELQYRYTWWGDTKNASARRQEFMDIYGDYFYASGVNSALHFQSAIQPHTYFYVFQYRSLNETNIPTWMGIPHGSDMQYTFGFPFMNDSWFKTIDGLEKMRSIRNNWNIMDGNTSEFMMIMMSNFAKYTNPTPWIIRNCTWFPLQPPDDYYLLVMDNCSIRQRYREGNMAFWRDRYEHIGDLQPVQSTFIPFPIYDYQITTFALAICILLALLALGILIFLIVRLRARMWERAEAEGQDVPIGGPHHEMQNITNIGLAKREGFGEGISTRLLTAPTAGALGAPLAAARLGGDTSVFSGPMSGETAASFIGGIAPPSYRPPERIFGTTSTEKKKAGDNPFDTGRMMPIGHQPGIDFGFDPSHGAPIQSNFQGEFSFNVGSDVAARRVLSSEQSESAAATRPLVPPPLPAGRPRAGSKERLFDEPRGSKEKLFDTADAPVNFSRAGPSRGSKERLFDEWDPIPLPEPTPATGALAAFDTSPNTRGGPPPVPPPKPRRQ